MEKIVGDSIDSTGYRTLFEYVKEEGIDKLLDFITDINNMDFRAELLLKSAIIYGKNDLTTLIKKNRDVTRFLASHENEFRSFSLTNTDILTVLTKLKENISYLDLYIDNAKRLEDLKVSRIRINDLSTFSHSRCEIYRNKRQKNSYITKSYTDGKIDWIGEEELQSEVYNSSYIPYIVDMDNATFNLTVQNSNRGYQTRWIDIKDFSFRGDKLPREEEIASYEIPKQLIKK